MPWVWAGTQPWRHQWISCWGNPGHRHTAPTGCGTATESSVSQVYSQAEQTQNTIHYSIYNFMMLGTLIFTSVRYTHRQNKHQTLDTTLYTILWCSGLNFHISQVYTQAEQTPNTIHYSIYNFMMLRTQFSHQSGIHTGRTNTKC